MARTELPVLDCKNPEPRLVADEKARKEARLRDERLLERREHEAREVSDTSGSGNFGRLPGHRHFSVDSVSKKVRNWLKTLGNSWHKMKPTPPTSQKSSDHGDSTKSSTEQSHEAVERPWQSCEDHAIILGRDDGESYHRISKGLDGRTTPDCIERHQYLRNNKKEWTYEETTQLFAHAEEYLRAGHRLGDAKLWKMIATEFECRSGADCWHHLKHQEIYGLGEDDSSELMLSQPKFSEAGDLEPESSGAESSETETSEPESSEAMSQEAPGVGIDEVSSSHKLPKMRLLDHDCLNFSSPG